METVFQFLQALADHNDRDWFKENRAWYEKAHAEVIEFADKLILCMVSHDEIEPTTGKKSLYRIYRDVRFSKDKTPYQTSWDGRFKRATESRRGGYYFHLESGNTFIVGGFWQPNTADILHIRKQLQQDAQPLRELLDSSAFKQYFGSLKGQKLKTAPRGFSKDDPDIDLLRHKGLILHHKFEEREVMKPDFHERMCDGFRRMRPFLDFMSDILTTDLNGRPLI